MEECKVVMVGGVVWRGVPEAAQGNVSLSFLYFLSLIINDGCFKLGNSAAKIQFSPGLWREGIKNKKQSSVLKAFVLL